MRFIRLPGAALASALALFAAPAWADGTQAGNTVSNTAQLTYQVGTTTQPQVTSNAATFVVDRRINLVVAELGGAATTVVGGQASQVTTFTVTNSTNATIDISLAATNQAGGTAVFGGGTDTFDVTNIRVYVDSNANGTYDAGVDTAIYLDEIAADATKTVFVVADIPVGQANGSVADVILTGTANEGGAAGTLGATVTQTNGANTLATVDTVFGDGAGYNDAARDGKYSARDQYNVVSATITFSKQVYTISDPFNGTTNQKSIPGSVMEYCLIVQNTGAADAVNIAISDVVPGTTTYVSNSALTNGQTTGSGASLTCDQTPLNGGTTTGASYASGTNTVSATIATVPAGGARTARFRVTVN